MIYLHKLLPLLVSPLSIICYFIIISFFTSLRWPRVCAIISIIIFSNPIIANYGNKYLEKDYPMTELKDVPKVDAIVVLSGMIKTVAKKNGGIDYQFNEAVERFETGINLIKLEKSESIIFTRGLLPWSTGMPEGLYLKSLAIMRGVNPKFIKLTSIVKNTDEEAEAVLNLIGNNNTIALVTSSFHMVRAIRVFEKRNFKIIPIAVDQRWTITKTTIMDFLPSGKALAENSRFAREIIGRLYYRFLY